MAKMTNEEIKKKAEQREKDTGKKEIEPDDFPGDGLAKRAATLINKNKKRTGKRLADIMRQINGR